MPNEWSAHLDSEARFWRVWFTNDRYRVGREARRAQLLTAFSPELVARLGLQPHETMRVLDVGSGPLSTLRTRAPNNPVELACVDALAEAYNELLDEFGYDDCPRIRAGKGETLTDQFPEDYFHWVHIANALDHCESPDLALEQMYRVCRPGGMVVVISIENEGEREAYNGLHRWNLQASDEGLLLWNRATSKNLLDCLPGGCEYSWKYVGERTAERAVFRVELWKHGAPSVGRESMTAGVSLEAFAGLENVVAPSLGYFGATPSDCLVVPVGKVVRRIVLRLEFEKPDFLNLKGIRLFAGGKQLTLSPADCELEQSSIVRDDPRHGPESLLAGNGAHTKGERNPYWRLVLRNAARIDELRILNREDTWGSRSAGLIVEVEGVEGGTIELYSGKSSRAAQALLTTLEQLLGPLPPLPPEADAALGNTWRLEVVRQLRDAVLAPARPLLDFPWRCLMQLVGTWAASPRNADEWILIAAFLLAQHKKHHSTSLVAFSQTLDTRSKLLHLQRVFAEVARSHKLEGHLVTRHGLSPVGKLLADPETALSHTRGVVDFLEAAGRKPILAYGTLLGAIRTGTFIPHDDDIDLMYFSQAGSQSEVLQDNAALRESLLKAGYRRVDQLSAGCLNMHVFHPKTGALTDIFPCWEEQGSLQMHMQGMKIRGIEPSIVYPRLEVALHGQVFPAPGRCEDFLRERYGAGWETPDQFFEWPWQLKEE